jgi:hypothetical protein
MQLTIEWFFLALTYVATGGAVFTDWGKNHKTLVALTGLVALITTGFFARDRYLEWFGGAPEPHKITADVTTLKFFDPITSRPRAWYSKSQSGTYTLYDASGFDPTTGGPLQPVTAEIARDILSKAAAAKEEERRRAEDAQIQQQQEVDKKAAQARQRLQDAQDLAGVQEQARVKPLRTRSIARIQYANSSRSSSCNWLVNGNRRKMNGAARTMVAISERAMRVLTANIPTRPNAFT